MKWISGVNKSAIGVNKSAATDLFSPPYLKKHLKKAYSHPVRQVRNKFADTMKFNHLPDAYRQRLAERHSSCFRSCVDAFVESCDYDKPDDNEIASEGLMYFAQRWPGDDFPFYGFSLFRHTTFEGFYWARILEVSLKYDVSWVNRWFSPAQFQCDTLDARHSFFQYVRSSLPFRWYADVAPLELQIHVNTENDMREMSTALSQTFPGP